MIVVLALATHVMPTKSMTMRHDGAGAAMRDAHHAARREDRLEMEELAAADDPNADAATMQLVSDRQPVGGQREEALRDEVLSIAR